MSKTREKEKRIISLAYFHRYGLFIVMTGLVLIIPELTLYIISICSILLSAWTLCGYILKWKHIFCSFQSANRETMTPHNIRWSQIKKSDVYVVSCIFFLLGVTGICIAILY